MSHPGVWVVVTDLGHLLVYRGPPLRQPDGSWPIALWPKGNRIERFCELSVRLMGWDALPPNVPIEVRPLEELIMQPENEKHRADYEKAHGKPSGKGKKDTVQATEVKTFLKSLAANARTTPADKLHGLIADLEPNIDAIVDAMD